MADAASVLTVDVAAITAAVTKEALAVEQARVDGLAEADLFAEVASVEEELKKAMAALEKKKGKPAEPEPPTAADYARLPMLADKAAIPNFSAMFDADVAPPVGRSDSKGARSRKRGRETAAAALPPSPRPPPPPPLPPPPRCRQCRHRRHGNC